MNEAKRDFLRRATAKAKARRAAKTLSLKNTLLFELFDDQKNILQAITLPDERQFSYYFVRGDDHAEFSIP